MLEDVRDDLALSAAAAGLLTTGPLLCLGLLAPLGPRIARRYPVERLLAGVAIALSQVVVPALVRARAPARAGVLTGGYSTSLVFGATLATFVAVPLEHLFGDWPATLAVWAVPAVAAAVAWLPLAAHAHDPVPAPVGTPPWRSKLGWSIALFMGLQSMCFFSTVSWLPEILHANGIGKGYAGFLTGLTQLIQVIPAFAIPVLAARTRHQYALLAAIVVCTGGGELGVLLAPGAALLWMVVLGFGQGGSLGLGIFFPVLRGRGPAEVASLTAMSMGVGYLIASTGPALVGAARDASGGWTWPLIVLLAMGLAQGPAGLYAAKGRPT